MKTRLQIPSNIRFALTVIVLLLGLNTILRTVFLLYNTAQAHALSWQDIFWGYAVGFRFDLATILIFNGLIFLYLVLPIKYNRHPRSYRFCNILLILMNMPILVVNAIDVVYYGFAEKRLTHELFTTKSDFGSFKPAILMEYWWLFLIFFIMVFVLYRLLNQLAMRHLGSDEKFKPLSRQWLWAAFFFGLGYTGMRGGLQNEPLSVKQAYVGDSFFSGSLGLNSAFTILKSVDWQWESIRLIPEEEAIGISRGMVRNDFDGEFVSSRYPLLRETKFEEPEQHRNVVFLIIESLNAKDVGILNHREGPSLTPNLDTLARHARVYSRYFANGTRSVESIPALLNSIPDIFERPTIGSKFIQNTHYGLPKMLKERGYRTSFFCGAHNGTMGFDKYAAASGIDEYFGMNEYPYAERDFDGYWGCADGPFLQWMGRKQGEDKRPFLSVFFSLSNHHPFILPDDDSKDIAALSLGKMEKTVMYTDRALGKYFKYASKQPWFKNTIFVITGDHCFHEESDPERTFAENFNVPLFLIGPDISPGMDDRVGQHVSVMPTLIELMRLKTYHSSTGLSLLQPASRTFAINNLMNVATLIAGDLAYSSSFERMQAFCRLENGHWTKKDVPGDVDMSRIVLMEHQLRCLFQVFHNTRIENTLHALPPRSISWAE